MEPEKITEAGSMFQREVIVLCNKPIIGVVYSKNYKLTVTMVLNFKA